MLEQDYIMRMINQLVQAMIHALHKAGLKDPLLEAQQEGEDALDAAQADGAEDLEGTATMLEVAFGECIGMDPEALLTLAPESFAMVMQVTGVDPELVPHLAKCLELEGRILEQLGDAQKADLRAAQAQSLATAFGV